MTPHQRIELERLVKHGPQALCDGRTKEGRAQRRLVALGYAEHAARGRIAITEAGRTTLAKEPGPMTTIRIFGETMAWLAILGLPVVAMGLIGG